MSGNVVEAQRAPVHLLVMRQALAFVRDDQVSDLPATHGGEGWAQWSLNRVDEGVALLDAEGRMHFANQSARELLAGSTVLGERGGCLTATCPTDQNALRAALVAAAQRGLFRLLRIGVGEAQQFLLLSPMGHGDGQRRVLCQFGRRTLCNRLSLQWYASSFHLSPAETNVLLQLCDGADPDDIADRHGVALSTVRTQIGAIREKTGHRSVRDLLRTLAMLPVISALPTYCDCAA